VNIDDFDAVVFFEAVAEFTDIDIQTPALDMSIVFPDFTERKIPRDASFRLRAKQFQ
jgi:hypothetical protein